MLQILHIAQIALAGYGIYNSFVAIRNLRGYEDTAKKAAKWSAEAEHQLYKTRMTQASGALAVVTSLVVATVLAFKGPSLPPMISGIASPVTLIGLAFARHHVKSYWAPGQGDKVGVKVPVPGAGDYNEAQEKTEELLKTLQWLEWSWAGTSLASVLTKY